MRGRHSTFSANEPEADFRSVDYPLQQVAIIFLRIIGPRREGKPLNSDPLAPVITDSTLDSCSCTARPSAASEARSWARVLARYRDSNHARSIVEIVITLGPLVGLWALAWTAYNVGLWWLSLLIAVPKRSV